MDYTVIVKLTDVCNLNCNYCYHKRNENHNYLKQMPLQVISEIISKILKNNNKYAEFIWHGGEPLLVGLGVYKYIVETQKKYNIKNLKIKNSIQTNGVLLDKQFISFFLENDFRIGVSLDGSEELQAVSRGTTTKEYIMISQGIKKAIEEGVHLGILCVVSPHSIGREEEIFKTFQNLCIDNIGFLPCFVVEKNIININDSVDPLAYGKFLINMFDIWKNCHIKNLVIRNFYDAIRFFRGVHLNTCTNINNCNTYITVTPNGNIYLCDNFGRDEMMLCGHIADDINKLQYSNGMKWLTNCMNSSLPVKCNSCEYQRGCYGGCKYQRFAQQDDMKKVYYYCESRKMLYNYVKKFVPIREDQ